MPTNSIRLLAALGLMWLPLTQAAQITIVPTDAPGEGVFDTTPFTPEGGNTATTLGEARRNVFQAAAEQWGAIIASDVEILVEASFAPAPETQCSSNSGTLGAAGPANFIAGFRGAPQANTFYPVALANALAGQDLDPGFADIVANFNGAVDTDPDCLTGIRFYYGFDHQGGNRAVDFYNTVMHEIGHGLGFTTLVANDGTNLAAPGFMVVDRLIFDNSRGLFWDEMSNAQRAASVVNDGNVVNTGDAAFAGARAQGLTSGNGTDRQGRPLIYAPNPAEEGSSIAHWDIEAQPSLLMEPFSTPDVRVNEGVDLTSCMLADMGWPLLPGVGCPDRHAADTPPEIGAISDQTTAAGARTAPIAFPVTDNARITPVDNLSLQAFSDNPEVAPDSGIAFGGSGANRTIEITPTSTPGHALITVVVSDGIFTARERFQLTVTEPANTPPQARDDLVELLSTETAAGNVIAGIGSEADSDAEGDTLRVIAVEGDAAAVGAAVTTAKGATAVIQADGELRYELGEALASLQPSRTETDSIKYRLGDGTGASDSALVTFRVTGDPGTDLHGDSAETATELQLTEAGDQLSAAINRPGDVDVFRFTLAERATVRLATSGDTDTVGQLLTTDGVLLAEGDDTTDGDATDPNFDLTETLSAGDYRLRVAGFQDRATGNYGLRYSAVAQPLPAEEEVPADEPTQTDNPSGGASSGSDRTDAGGSGGGGSGSPGLLLLLALGGALMRYRLRRPRRTPSNRPDENLRLLRFERPGPRRLW